MKFTSIFSTLVLIATALAEDITVTSDRNQYGRTEINYGDVSVSKDANYNLINAKFVHLHGDFENDGSVYVSSNNGDFGVDFRISGVNSKTVNNGQLVVQSGESFTFPAFHIGGHTFENNGKVFFGGYGQTGVPTSRIVSRSFDNKGLIALYQDKRNSGLVNLGAFWGSMTNDGTVCLKNQAFSQHARINGKGCFDIGENANVWIKSAALPVSEDQTFFFSSTGGSIRVEAVSAPQTFHVRNWGKDNVIGLSLPISSFSYSQDGILKVKCGLLDFEFDIGTGYDIMKMRQVTADYGVGIGSVINGGIVYDGDAPSSDRPETCAACDEIPPLPEFSQ